MNTPAPAKIPLKKTALILPGAGARGRFQAGCLKAIRDSKVKIDLVFGTSSGALNGALFHQGDVDQLIDLWTNIKNSDVYAPRPWHLLGRDKYVFNTTPLQKLLKKLIQPQCGRNPPFFVSVTDVETLKPKTFAYNNFYDDGARELLRASAALPLLFPPVRLGLRLYSDGGVGRNMPLTTALDYGATRLIILLPTPPASSGREDGIADELARIFGSFENGVCEVELAAARLKPGIELIIVRPEDNPSNSLLQFHLPQAASKLVLDSGYEICKGALKRAGLWPV